MFNKITIIGNVGRDPEMTYTPNGKALTKFSIASNRRYTSGGERKEEVDWFNVTAFGRLAEVVSEYVKKGSKLYVEGRFHSNSWEGKDGVTRTSNEIMANEVVFLDPPGETGDGEAKKLPPRAAVSDPAPVAGGGIDADDLPF